VAPPSVLYDDRRIGRKGAERGQGMARRVVARRITV
jgi:hypothetical protein